MLWQKQHRAEQLARNYQYNRRSNKHGQHNRRCPTLQRRLTSNDRRVARHARSERASRKHPVEVAWQAIQAMRVKQPCVSDLAASIRDVKQIGAAGECLSMALSMHAHELMKAAQAALSKTLSSARAIQATELVQLFKTELAKSHEVPAQLQNRAREILRRVQGASGLLQQASKMKQDALSRQKRVLSYPWSNTPARNAQSLRVHVKKTAVAEVSELLGDLFPLDVDRFHRRRHHRELPRPVCCHKADAIERHDFVSSIDVDVFDSEAAAEHSYLEPATRTEDIFPPAPVHHLTQNASASEVKVNFGKPPCHCMFSVTASKEFILGACHDVHRKLKGSLKDMLVKWETFNQLAGECELQRQELHRVIQSQESCSVSGIDAYTGLQAMGQQAEHALPDLTASQIACQPLQNNPFLIEKKGLRQAMAKVVKVQQTCHQIHERVRRRYRGGAACRLITSSCLTLHSQPCACRLSSAASELSALVCRCVGLRDELSQYLEDNSHCRQRSLDECHGRLQALKQELADKRMACQQSQALISEWLHLGSRLREECAQQLRNAFPLDESAVTQCHFNRLRDIFVQQHGFRLLRHLRRVFPNLNLRLVQASVSLRVQAAFLQAWRNQAGPSIDLSPAFHGTRESNIPSILEQGLLIPGRGNRLKVVHGAVHGRGIYTAKVHNPCLSAGFAGFHPQGMLVVGILDDAVVHSAQKRLGNYSVGAESKAVIHVGDAMVVFEPSHVVPFFSVAVC